MSSTTKKRSNARPIRAASPGVVSLVDAPMTTAGSTATHEFVPDLALDLVDPNPYNIRERAIADDELIASIRSSGLVEPLVVVPNPDYVADAAQKTGRGPAKFRLAAGHRRLDAMLRLELATAPAIIRYDLDTPAKQVEAMLIENGRRQDLSPIEEAKGYHQLTLFGIKQADIAKAVGRDRKTVSARLKLLDLNNNVQTKVTDGQVTIDDAIAIAALPQSEQTKVANSVGTWSFKQELEAARRRTEKKAEIDTKVVDLKAAGIPRRNLPAGKSVWTINDADDGMVRLGQTFSSDPDDHDGCLAWIRSNDTELDYVCTNVSAHDEQLSEQQRIDREAAERIAAETKARAEAKAVATRLRADALLESVKPGIKLDPAAERLLRLLVRAMVFELGYAATTYQEALDIPKDLRWERYASTWKPRDLERFEDHLAAATKPADLLRQLAAVLVAKNEETYLSYLSGKGHRSPHSDMCQQIGRAFIDLAQAAGHQLTELERELLAEAEESAS